MNRRWGSEIQERDYQLAKENYGDREGGAQSSPWDTGMLIPVWLFSFRCHENGSVSPATSAKSEEFQVELQFVEENDFQK